MTIWHLEGQLLEMQIRWEPLAFFNLRKMETEMKMMMIKMLFSINLIPQQEWELKHLRSHLCQKSQSCTSAVFDNLIWFTFMLRRQQKAETMDNLKTRFVYGHSFKTTKGLRLSVFRHLVSRISCMCIFNVIFHSSFCQFSQRMREICILEKLNFTIFRGSMPPDPPSVLTSISATPDQTASAGSDYFETRDWARNLSKNSPTLYLLM